MVGVGDWGFGVVASVVGGNFFFRGFEGKYGGRGRSGIYRWTPENWSRLLWTGIVLGATKVFPRHQLPT